MREDEKGNERGSVEKQNTLIIIITAGGVGELQRPIDNATLEETGRGIAGQGSWCAGAVNPYLHYRTVISWEDFG